ncbi:TQO small subunit DoxD [Bradyrhizobium embrapense]|uniref:TQO small subunit DoxD n=1 Tax=Bradyrhizobium embrapense TaxID=630921 RepID=UPI00067CDECC|nr:TQO small subunit DoxD [Bradyrhizobium embrapense]
MTTSASVAAATEHPTRRSVSIEALDETNWRGAALGLLTVRVVEGFIYWGGGSRRFIYDPEKLDPSGHEWMANKLQDAMPGALFGTDQIIAFMLRHFDILYPAIILFSVGELLAGIMLIAGFMTRIAAVGALGFSVLLMVMFGWIGAVCLEGWTMAACNIAMSCALMLNGSSAYSLDNLLLRHHPQLAARGWFRWNSGSLPLPLSERGYHGLAVSLFLIATIFIVGLYSHYRGAVLTPFHPGPVSPSVTHFSLDGATINGNAVKVRAYLDAGTPEAPVYIVEAKLEDGSGKALAQWDAAALAALSRDHIENEFAYNQIIPGPHGLVARMGAKAVIRLPLESALPPASQNATIRLTTVDGRNFAVKLETSQ